MTTESTTMKRKTAKKTTRNPARLPVVTDAAAVGAARTTMDSWAKGIRENKFDPCPGDHCKHCDVREICRHRKG